MLTNIVGQLSESMPKGMSMLVRAITKQIDEDKIDEILTGILDWLGSSYEAIEKIQADIPDEKLLESATTDEVQENVA